MKTQEQNQLVIDENNFSEYFKDISNNKPDKGDTIACYTTKAFLGSGALKKDIIFSMEENIQSSIKILQKLAKSRYIDSINVLKQMISDRLSGMSREEVENKEYEYVAEFFYYVKKEYIPENDPHWSTLKIHNINEFLDKDKNVLCQSKIVEQD